VNAPERYRKNAADCIFAAEKVHGLVERAILLQVARGYLKLADYHSAAFWGMPVAGDARQNCT
jgi:hypothetical protein